MAEFTGIEQNLLRRVWPPEALSDPTLQTIRDEFRRCLESPSCEDFLRTVLGVYVAGFIFIDPVTNEIDPLLYSKSIDEESVAFMTPYVWAHGREAASDAGVVDGMFRIWRTRESIKKSDYGWQERCRPEYLSRLPLTAEDDKETHWLGNTIRRYFHCHYVPLGETKFFLYSWRLLLRCAQLANWDWDSRFSDGRNHRPKIGASYGPVGTIWDRRSWETNRDTREHDWARFCHPGQDSDQPEIDRTGKDGGVRTHFLDVAHKNVEVADNGHVWTKEWLSLNLVEEMDGGVFRVKRGLLAMLRFASLGICPAGDDGSCQALAEAIATLSRTIAQVQVHVNGVLGSSALCELDECLQQVVESWLANSGQAPTMAEALENLHRQLRFPLLPYYYWTALDTPPDDAWETDKTHLVVPVWEEPDGVIVVPLDEDGRKERTPVVGVAVVGVRPIDEIDWTLSENDCGLSSKSESLALHQIPFARFARLQLIVEYLRLLARIPASCRYYRRKFESEKARAAQLRAIASAIHGTTTAVRGIHTLELCKLLFTQAPPVGVSDFRFPVSTDSLTRVEAIIDQVRVSILSEDMALAFVSLHEMLMTQTFIRNKFLGETAYPLREILSVAREMVNYSIQGQRSYYPVTLVPDPDSDDGWIAPAGYIADRIVRGIVCEILRNGSRWGRVEEGVVIVRCKMIPRESGGVECVFSNHMREPDPIEQENSVDGFLLRLRDALIGNPGLSLNFKPTAGIFESRLGLGVLNCEIGEKVTESRMPTPSAKATRGRS